MLILLCGAAGRQYSPRFMMNLEGKPWKYRKKYPFLFVDHIFHLLSWQQAIRALVHSQGPDLLLRAFGAAIDMIRALVAGGVLLRAAIVSKRPPSNLSSNTPSTLKILRKDMFQSLQRWDMLRLHVHSLNLGSMPPLTLLVGRDLQW